MTIAPVLALLLSALITWLIRNLHNRIQWVVSSVMGFTVWVLMIFIDVNKTEPLSLSIWQPADLFQSPIIFSIDLLTWPLIYGASTVLLAVILTAATRPNAVNVGHRSFWFFYTALTMMAIMSTNLLTLAVAWVMMDFGTLFFLLAISVNESDKSAIFVRTLVNVFSVLLVIAAALVSDIQGIVTPDLNATSSFGILALALAASFRLGLIPLHLATRPIDSLRRGAGTLLRLFPPVVAMALLARVFAAGLPDGLKYGFYIAGGAGGILGGIRWVLHEETARARPFFVLSLASLGLIVAAIAPNSASVVVATGLLMLLVGAVISLFSHHTPSHRLVPILASLLLLGAPFTPGGVYAAVVGAPEVFFAVPGIGVLVLVIATLLALGCFQLFFAVETKWPIGESLSRVMFNVGLILPILAAFGVGFWRVRANPIPGAFFFVAGLLLSSILFIGLRALSANRVEQLREIIDRFEPAHLYETLWRGGQRTLLVFREVGEIFEGISGMLWLFVLVITILFIIK